MRTLPQLRQACRILIVRGTAGMEVRPVVEEVVETWAMDADKQPRKIRTAGQIMKRDGIREVREDKERRGMELRQGTGTGLVMRRVGRADKGDSMARDEDLGREEGVVRVREAAVVEVVVEAGVAGIGRPRGASISFLAKCECEECEIVA